MQDRPYRVAVVVDPTFGERLAELSRTVHVWACDSPENRLAADRARTSAQDVSLEHGVTLFKYLPSDSPDQVCLGILHSVDLHHGHWSHTPPWGEIEVYGTELTLPLRQGLIDLAFSKFDVTTAGFIAMREKGRTG